jgi:hypothetical protein
MGGQTDVRRLLADMEPELQEGEFVFCTVSPGTLEHLGVEPIGWFREAEGISVIVDRSAADRAGLEYDFVSRMITLSVHSSLHAVGFLAAIAGKLAAAGISVNPVCAYYHDNLFVSTADANAAMEVLDELSTAGC